MKCEIHCPNPTEATSFTGYFFSILGALLFGAGWLLWQLAKLAGPALVVLGVLAWRWSTGAPMRPGVRGRHVRRYVRATGNNLVTVAVACIMLWPVATAATLAALLAGLVTAVAWVRVRPRWQAYRLARRRQVIRVKAKTGPARRRGPVAQLPAVPLPGTCPSCGQSKNGRSDCVSCWLDEQPQPNTARRFVRVSGTVKVNDRGEAR
jgi:hypothetical protein